MCCLCLHQVDLVETQGCSLVLNHSEQIPFDVDKKGPSVAFWCRLLLTCLYPRKALYWSSWQEYRVRCTFQEEVEERLAIILHCYFTAMTLKNFWNRNGRLQNLCFFLQRVRFAETCTLYGYWFLKVFLFCGADGFVNSAIATTSKKEAWSSATSPWH